METPKSYTCTGCGYTSKWPLPAEEVEACRRMRRERLMNCIRLGVVIVTCIALPILLYVLVARLP